MDTPMTELPDGSGCCTTTILSEEEAMSLPLSQRPLNYRLPGDLYHAVFEAVGAASMCWDPRPSFEVFDSRAAEKVAMDLCFKIAAELDLRPNCPNANPDLDCGEGYRFLRPGETILEGDEAWMGGMKGVGWSPTSRAGTPAPSAATAPVYRRRRRDAPATPEPKTCVSLDPGEGYRILERGEAIRGSDQFLDHRKWCCVSSIPCLIDLRVQNIKIRRKIDLDHPPQSASMPTG